MKNVGKDILKRKLIKKDKKEVGRVTKKERQEHIEYIKQIVNKDIKFDKRKE